MFINKITLFNFMQIKEKRREGRGRTTSFEMQLVFNSLATFLNHANNNYDNYQKHNCTGSCNCNDGP